MKDIIIFNNLVIELYSDDSFNGLIYGLLHWMILDMLFEIFIFLYCF
jgi:hypothetical protein